MPGKEHPQYDFLEAAITGTVPVPSADVLSATGTTNQQFLGAACALAYARLNPGAGPSASQAIQTALRLFELMADFGHQAIGASRQNEQGAPEPHTRLYVAALGTILRESWLQGLPVLKDLALSYFADHLRLAMLFDTAAGPRMPCARAKTAPGQALLPDWSTDAQLLRLIMNHPSPKGAAMLDPFLSRLVVDLAWAHPEIRKRVAGYSGEVPLRLLIRRWWREGGGFTAAWAEEEELNDGCAWLTVDGAGRITAAGRSLSDFAVPAGPPQIIGRRPDARRASPPPSMPATPATAPGKEPPMPEIPAGTTFRSVAVWLRNLDATQAVYKDRSGAHALSTWTPQGDHDDIGFVPGGASSPSQGSWVGERYSRDLFLTGILAGVFPLDRGYQPTDRDQNLLEYIAIPNTPGPMPAWDAVVVPALVKAGIMRDTGSTGPTREPNGGELPAPQTATDVTPQAPLHPAPLPPAPASPPVTAPDNRELGRQKILEGLELIYPGQAAQYGALAALLANPEKPTFFQLIAAAEPLFG